MLYDDLEGGWRREAQEGRILSIHVYIQLILFVVQQKHSTVKAIIL